MPAGAVRDALLGQGAMDTGDGLCRCVSCVRLGVPVGLGLEAGVTEPTSKAVWCSSTAVDSHAVLQVHRVVAVAVS